jgi:small-conductance mechanosensitive channel
MKALIQWLQNLFQGGLTEIQVKIILTIVLLVLLWILRRVVKRSITRIPHTPQAKYNWNKTITYIFNSISVIGVALLWFNQFESLATFLGLLSAGLAIAFRDPIVNMAGWYFLIFRKPFKVGDRIQVDEHTGDIIDIKMFEFSMIEVGNWVHSDQSTGRVLHIPNQRVFSSAIANYNAIVDFIWNEIEVTITFESDWKKAKQLFTRLLNQHAPKRYLEAEEELKHTTGDYLVYYNKLTPIVYTSVVDHGVRFSLRYLCPPKQRRGSAEILWEAILEALGQEEKIHLAYPTTRIIRSEDKTN